MNIFRLYPGLKMSFEHNSVRKNLFLSACFCWDSIFSLREVDQKFPLGGLIGHGNSCLDSILCYTKVFRLHALLHDGAGAVRSHTGKEPDYCYMFERRPNSCLLGLVTEFLFCHYVKVFVPSIFNSVDFWSSMSLIVLDIELTEENIIKELGLVIDGSLQGLSFCLPQTFKAIKQTTWNTSHLYGIAWSIGKPDYDKLFAVFYNIKVMNAEMFAKGLEKCRLLTRLLGQNVKILDDWWLWLPKISRFCQNGQLVDLF